MSHFIKFRLSGGVTLLEGVSPFYQRGCRAGDVGTVVLPSSLRDVCLAGCHNAFSYVVGGSVYILEVFYAEVI